MREVPASISIGRFAELRNGAVEVATGTQDNESELVSPSRSVIV